MASSSKRATYVNLIVAREDNQEAKSEGVVALPERSCLARRCSELFQGASSRAGNISSYRWGTTLKQSYEIVAFRLYSSYRRGENSTEE